MAEVVSLAEAAARFATLDAEVTRVAGPAGSFEEKPPAELRFAEGDDVQIIYRALEGRPEIRATLYGPTIKRVAQGLCRDLGRTGAQIVAMPAGDPRPFDLTWVEIARGQPGAGTWLARVRGVTFTQLNIALGRPVRRIEMIKGRPSILFDPDALERRAETAQVIAPIDIGDDDDV